MGKHAQYRKRGTASSSDIYPVPPPTGAEWDLRVNAASLEIKLLVTPDSPRYGLIPEWQRGGETWQLGPAGHTPGNWFQIAFEPGVGDYGLRVAWSDVTTHGRISQYSAIKLIAIT